MTSAMGTDGAVIKLLNLEQRETVGFTSRAPRWASAFKYPSRAEGNLF
jgi:DNA ligase (NAD+)